MHRELKPLFFDTCRLHVIDCGLLFIICMESRGVSVNPDFASLGTCDAGVHVLRQPGGLQDIRKRRKARLGFCPYNAGTMDCSVVQC